MKDRAENITKSAAQEDQKIRKRLMEAQKTERDTLNNI